MPELLGPAGAKTDELMAKDVHSVTTGQYKTRTAVGRPHLICRLGLYSTALYIPSQ